MRQGLTLPSHHLPPPRSMISATILLLIEQKPINGELHEKPIVKALLGTLPYVLMARIPTKRGKRGPVGFSLNALMAPLTTRQNVDAVDLFGSQSHYRKDRRRGVAKDGHTHTTWLCTS